MPSFVGAFNQDDPGADFDDRWAVAHYIRSITRTEPESEGTVLRVWKVDGELPQSPTDPAWDEAPEIHFRLFGQATRRPRWQIPAVDHVQVRALYSDTEIAIRLVYHDRTESREHADPDSLDEPTSYPEIDAEVYEDRQRLLVGGRPPPASRTCSRSLRCSTWDLLEELGGRRLPIGSVGGDPRSPSRH